MARKISTSSNRDVLLAHVRNGSAAAAAAAAATVAVMVVVVEKARARAFANYALLQPSESFCARLSVLGVRFRLHTHVCIPYIFVS